MKRFTTGLRPITQSARLCLSLAFTLFVAKDSLAQSAASYVFTPVQGTYTEITGGTGVSAIQVDQALSQVPIGFNFSYCGNTYSQALASSNGWLSFKLTSTNSCSSNEFTYLNSDVKPGLMALWDDHSGAGGTASYKTEGTAPNRVFTLEWKNWKWYYNAPAPVISFQVKLYETTNIIEYHYRQEAEPVYLGTTGPYMGATIGISDGQATVGYLSLNNTSASPTASATVYTTDLITKPATGQIYRFSPPTTTPQTCAAPTAPTATGITATTAVLNWTESGTANQWQIKYGAAGFNVNTGGTAILTGTKPYTLNPPLSPSTAYEYYVRAICGPNDTSAWSPAAAFTTLCSTPAVTSFNGASRCGAGTVQLTAATSAGAAIQWYAAATGGSALATGNSFTTPNLSTTTSYYITAKSGSCESSPRQEVVATINEAASVASITADLSNAPTVAFQAVDPQHVATYAWDFGSGGGTSALQNPSYLYPASPTAQTYTVRLVVHNDCGNDTVITNVTIPGNTNVNNLNVAMDALKLYPNPATNLVKLEHNSAYRMKQLVITNVLGQTVLSVPLSDQQLQQINVASLPAGMYHVQVIFEEGVVNRKLELLR